MTAEVLTREQLNPSGKLEGEINAIAEQVRVEEEYPILISEAILRYGPDNGPHWDRRIYVRCSEELGKTLQVTGAQPLGPERSKFIVQISEGDEMHNHEPSAVYVRPQGENQPEIPINKFDKSWLLKSSHLTFVWYAQTPQGNSRFELAMDPLSYEHYGGKLTQTASSGHTMSEGRVCYSGRYNIADQLNGMYERRMLEGQTQRIINGQQEAAATLAVREALAS